MSARPRVSYTTWYERPRHTRGTGISPPLGRPTRPGGILDRGSRRVPRRRSPLGPAVGRRPSRGRGRRPLGPSHLRATAQADVHPGEDHPAVVGRQADRARLRDRSLDRAAPGPHDPPGVRDRTQSEVPHRLAPPPRLYAAETPACPAPARAGGDRRVAADAVAAHQKKARRQGAHLALMDESGLLMAPLVRRTWAPRGQPPALEQSG